MAGQVYGTSIRESEYAMEPNYAYTNHGSYGFAPKVVEAERVRIQKEINVRPDYYYRYEERAVWSRNLRAACEYLGLPFEYSVFVENTTNGMNNILSSFPFQSGDRILTTNLIYCAVQYAAESTAAKSNLETVLFPIRFPIKSISVLVEQFDATFQANEGRIRLLIIDAIASYSAARLPLRELVAVARRHNAVVVIDAAHACGQLTKAEVRELYDLGDFFVSSLHKWMFTSRPAGLMSMKPEYSKVIRPAITSWGYPLREQDLHSHFFESATKDYVPLFTMEAALDFRRRLDELAPGGVYQFNKTLVEEAAQRLAVQLDTQCLRYCEQDEENARFLSPFMREVLAPKSIQSWIKKDLQPVASKGAGSWIPGASSYVNERKSSIMKLLSDKYRLDTLLVDNDSVEDSPCICIRISAQVYCTLGDFERLGSAVLEIVRLIDNSELDNLLKCAQSARK